MNHSLTFQLTALFSLYNGHDCPVAGSGSTGAEPLSSSTIALIILNIVSPQRVLKY
jgi:hypothetical protein